MKFLSLKGLLIPLFLLFFVGCFGSKPKPTPPKDNSATNNQSKIGGINTHLLKNEQFKPQPIPSYYYGQLVVETTLYENAIKGPNALKFQNYLIKLFGSEQKQFGISLTPTINGIKLPDVILFSYAYNSQKSHWQSDYVAEYVSPFIKLDSNTILAYELKHNASNYVNSSLVQKVNTIIDEYSAIAPGAWAISEASKPIVQSASKFADTMIEAFLTQSVSADVSSQLQPAFNGRKAQTIKVTDNENNPLADIRISVRLANSLLNSQTEAISSDFIQSVPKMIPFIDPLNTIKVNGKENRTIRQDLTTDINRLANIKSPNEFSGECHYILNNKLQSTYGLTRFDALNAMRYLLRTTKFSKSKALYNSGCLSDEDFELLRLMGVPIKLNDEFLEFDPELYPNIGKLMQSPNDKSRVKNIKRFFSDDVFISTDKESTSLINGYLPGYAYSRDDIINLFSEMNAARFCCIKRPEVNGQSLKNGQQMFFRRAKDKTLYSLEFYRGKRKPFINHIILKVLDYDEISQNRKTALLKSIKEDEYY
ncbi:MAG: hypothetical protein K0U38_01000 [Epsilonproteobacteria bacterium]|nr:hypothetical protein [Campylobacterota bacterium]